MKGRLWLVAMVFVAFPVAHGLSVLQDGSFIEMTVLIPNYEPFNISVASEDTGRGVAGVIEENTGLELQCMQLFADFHDGRTSSDVPFAGLDRTTEPKPKSKEIMYSDSVAGLHGASVQVKVLCPLIDGGSEQAAVCEETPFPPLTHGLLSIISRNSWKEQPPADENLFAAKAYDIHLTVLALARDQLGDAAVECQASNQRAFEKCARAILEKHTTPEGISTLRRLSGPHPGFVIAKSDATELASYAGNLLEFLTNWQQPFSQQYGFHTAQLIKTIVTQLNSLSSQSVTSDLESSSSGCFLSEQIIQSHRVSVLKAVSESSPPGWERDILGLLADATDFIHFPRPYVIVQLVHSLKERGVKALEGIETVEGWDDCLIGEGNNIWDSRFSPPSCTAPMGEGPIPFAPSNSVCFPFLAVVQSLEPELLEAATNATTSIKQDIEFVLHAASGIDSPVYQLTRLVQWVVKLTSQSCVDESAESESRKAEIVNILTSAISAGLLYNTQALHDAIEWAKKTTSRKLPPPVNTTGWKLGVRECVREASMGDQSGADSRRIINVQLPYEKPAKICVRITTPTDIVEALGSLALGRSQGLVQLRVESGELLRSFATLKETRLNNYGYLYGDEMPAPAKDALNWSDQLSAGMAWLKPNSDRIVSQIRERQYPALFRERAPKAFKVGQRRRGGGEMSKETRPRPTPSPQGHLAASPLPANS